MSSPKIHPPTLVTNIKNCVPIQLDDEGTHFNTWCTLFKLHCHAHLVDDHIIAGDDSKTSSTDPEWQRLDDIVRPWLYATISIPMIRPKMHGTAFYKIFKITKPLAFFISQPNSMISNFVTFPMSKPIAPNSIILPLLSTISAHPLLMIIWLCNFFVAFPKITKLSLSPFL